MDMLSFWTLYTLASITLPVTQIQGQQETKKVKVQVYYETLCPDSKRFVKQQLSPLLKNGGAKHIDVEFIPYGKATTTIRGSSHRFSCQHGKPECEGNKMHACAIKYLNKSEQIDFITCSMGKSYPPTSLTQCANEVGIDGATRNKISMCANSVEGDHLLAAHGEQTHNLKPKLFFVPTITYNGIFEVEKMWQSQNDFHGVICHVLEDGPNFCPRS